MQFLSDLYPWLTGAIGGLLGAAFLLPTKLGEALFKYRFDRAVEAFKAEQGRELEILKEQLNHLGDRGKRSNEMEFTAITAIWDKFVAAYLATRRCVVRFIEIPSFGAMTADEFEAFLSAVEFTDTQKLRLSSASDREKAYSEIWAARAIFKDWFVDFGPTRAKMEGRVPYLAPELWAIFPDRFDQEGQPEGWKYEKLGNLCARVAMGPFGSDITTDNFVESGVPIIRGANLKDGFVGDAFVYLTEAKADELKNANAFAQDIVITHRGTLGQVGIIPKKPTFPRYVVSQSQMLLTVDNSKTTPRFIFEFLRSTLGVQQLLAFTSQTGVPAIARPTTSLKSLNLIEAPLPVILQFDSLLAPLVDRESANLSEIRTLAATRDLLLPKLIAGEIRLRDAEKALEAVA